MSGYKLVPVDPTAEMLSAPLQGGRFENRVDLRSSIYRAMLAAAPAVQGEAKGSLLAPMKIEHHAPGITIEKDILGTVHIKVGDFDYIQIRYQYPYTDNASQAAHARLIADALTGAAPQPIKQYPNVGTIGHVDHGKTSLTASVARIISEQPAEQQPVPNAPTPTFHLGDHVRKAKGSQWKGRVVGTYSTDLTPEGYAVESDTEKGSVQIYPVGALELVGGLP